MRTTRPWGYFDVLLDNENSKVKKIFINPNSRISLQLHKKRSEYWTIINGSGFLLDGTKVSVGSTVFVPENTKHRITAGESGLEFIEVQLGESFSEEDIVRFEDDYERTTYL